MFPPKHKTTNPHGGVTAEKVIVAVKAEKVISKAALAWALTHAARPGDCITLLAIFSEKKTGGRGFWRFPRLKGNCRSCDPAKLPDRVCQISESCSQMILQVQDQIEVRVRIKVVSTTFAGAVAAEAKSNSAHWVILNKKLKDEIKHCMDELRCNIIVMKGSQPKVVRLNLAGSRDLRTPLYSAASLPIKDGKKLQCHNVKRTTHVSSPEYPNSSYTRTSVENSISASDAGSSIYVVYEENPLYEEFSKDKHPSSTRLNMLDHLKPGTPESETCSNQVFLERGNGNNISKATVTSSRTEQHNNFIQYRGTEINQNSDGNSSVCNSSIWEAVSFGKTSSIPPPLCTLCKSKAPGFGEPPKQFQYKELKEATHGFSDTNFMSEDGFGSVHRGVLRNGLTIAVKKIKFAGPQRDADFCREVCVLSCAQHRNVVLLIGFCIEGNKRFLVYEYICNRSLDFHLHVAGNKNPVLDWQTRLKIAIGTARGLRYLHEDCRVGCIIHRNLRPNNILLTHDFEPLVADFGLARLHSECELYDRNQTVGSSWHLAPEYFNGGKMTEKVDIYAFGLVLLELITGQRAHDLQYMGHQFLLDQIHAFPTTRPPNILASYQLQRSPYELHSMGSVASLCLQQDPNLRPPMSKVVKMLEGGNAMALDFGTVGCRSGHLQGLSSNTQFESKTRHSRRLSY
ncbi:hypothetical protein ABFS82_14G252700 [Erythranthe guttata]